MTDYIKESLHALGTPDPELTEVRPNHQPR